MSSLLYRIARWSVRRRLVVLLAWLLIAVAAISLGALSGGKVGNSFSIPGTQSQEVSDLLAEKLPALSGGQAQVVFDTPGRAIAAPAYRTAIAASVERLAAVQGVEAATDPFQTQALSRDGHVALGSVQFRGNPGDVSDATLAGVTEAVKPAQEAGVKVEFAGSVYPGYQPPPSELPEVIGLIVAFLILLVTLGSLIAAGLPIATALIGVAVALTGVLAVGTVVDLSSASVAVTLMLGLSCGIDYGLFIVSRHRGQLIAGMDPDESIALAVGTAGSAVVFAGATVVVALAGVAVLGIPFLTVMGLAAAGAVLIAVLIAVTLLPALLGFAGGRMARFLPVPRVRQRAERVARRAASNPEGNAGGAWARFVVRFRVPVLIVGSGLLILAALPITTMKLGLPTAETQPTSSTARQAYDITTASFGAGFNGTLLVTVEGVRDAAQVRPAVDAIERLDDVAAASIGVVQNGTALISVIPDSGPNSAATEDLVTALRQRHATFERLSDSPRVLVGGLTASNIDVSDKVGSAIPIFLAVIIGIAFVLLTFAFRTILVPLKSIAGFLLSVGAAMGVQVAVFQWGWGSDLLGITPGRIISFIPVLMLAIIFGLSSDYEIFVVSRVKERFTRTGDATEAVIRGTALSARVVTAAALIMTTVFAAFIVNPDSTLKAVGFSFALGVFIDAFVVRLTLVPAFMAIVGSRIWYHPRWFAKYVPDPDIEGERLARADHRPVVHA